MFEKYFLKHISISPKLHICKEKNINGVEIQMFYE